MYTRDLLLVQYHRLCDRGRCVQISLHKPGKTATKSTSAELNVSSPNTLIHTSVLSYIAGYLPCPKNQKCLLSSFLHIIMKRLVKSHKKLQKPPTRRNRPKITIQKYDHCIVFTLITNQLFYFSILSVSDTIPFF